VKSCVSPTALGGFVCGVAPQEHTAGEDRRDPLSPLSSAVLSAAARDERVCKAKDLGVALDTRTGQRKVPLLLLCRPSRGPGRCACRGRQGSRESVVRMQRPERVSLEMKNKCKTCGIGLGPLSQCRAPQSGHATAAARAGKEGVRSRCARRKRKKRKIRETKRLG
jgi:hypothetical protein